MAVKIVRAIREGWKQQDNQRFGQCMEVRFIDTKTGKVMFRYAPTLEDQLFWDETFAKLKVYDQLHKNIYSLVKSIDPEFTVRGLEECLPKKED